MEMNQLRGFYEIAREHSFTRAADKLFLTQPAISLQVKALEEELGEMLFERTRKNIRMTPAGEILFQRVREVFQHLEMAREEIAALQRELRGRLAIGTSDTNCTYVLPGILSAFRQRYPQVELDIRNRMTSEVLPLIINNEVNFGLVTLPVRHRNLVSEKLYTRPDVLICPPGHALARRKYVRLEEVGEHPLLVLERGSTSRQLLEDDFRRVGVVPEVAMSLGGIDVIKRLVEIGLGLALVPRVAVREEVEAGRLAMVAVRGFAAREIGLVEHRGRRRAPTTVAFLEILKQHVDKVKL